MNEQLIERTYCVGLPVVVTVHTDGSTTFEVDLAEVNDIDEDECAYERYGEDTVYGDASTVSAAASKIGNTFSTTVNPTISGGNHV